MARPSSPAWLTRWFTALATTAALVATSACAADASAASEVPEEAAWSAPAFVRTYGWPDPGLVYPRGLSFNAVTSEVIVSDVASGRVRRFDFDGRHVGDLASQLSEVATTGTDPTNGDIYAFDPARTVLLRHDATGALVNEIDLGGNATPWFDVDSTGVVWIAVGPRSARYQLQRYRGDGTPLPPVPLTNTAPRPLQVDGLAVANDGRIFVADGRNRLIHVFAPDGAALFTFGHDVLGRKLYGVALDEPNGLLYTSDAEWNVVRKFRLDGTFRENIGEPGEALGDFRDPRQLDVDPATGHLYVAEGQHRRYQRFSRHGVFLQGFPILQGGAARGGLAFPSDVAVDPTAGRVYVTDALEQEVIRFFENGGAEHHLGGEWPWLQNDPSAVAVDSATNRLWAAQHATGKVKVWQLDAYGTVHTFRVGARPTDIALFDGEAFVTDEELDSVQVFDAATLAPVASIDVYDGEGPSGVQGIAIDPGSGDLFIASDTEGEVRRYTRAGALVARFGSPGYAPGRLRSPRDVTILDGVVYVADAAQHRVSAFSPNGEYLGRFGGEGDRAYQLRGPTGLESFEGLLYVTEAGNRRVSVFDTTTPKPAYVFERPRVGLDRVPSEVRYPGPLSISGSASGETQPIGTVEWSVQRLADQTWWNQRTMSWQSERVANLASVHTDTAPSTSVRYGFSTSALPFDESYRLQVMARNVHGTPSQIRSGTTHLVGL